MLELEVLPDISIGYRHWKLLMNNEEFMLMLGMAFSQVVHIIQQQFQSIRGVQVLYSELNPLTMDLVINLSHDGIKLIFDPLCQRLKVIEVYNMSKVKLKYCGIAFCSPEVPPTIEQIDHSFGATHPGVYDSTQQVFVLNFRGLSFSFPIESRFQPRYAHGLGSLQFPNGASPVVSKMSIYSGNSLAETRPPPLPMTSFCNHCFLDKLEVLRDKDTTIGIKLLIIAEGFGSHQLMQLKKKIMTKVVKFGDSAQDVTSALGSPSKVFYKAEDKMKIHSPNSHRYLKWSCSDYFYNYFTLGFDILFDAKSHSVKKIILHTNYPGHYNFNIYFRCNFSLTLIMQKAVEAEGATLIDVTEQKTQTITPITKWDTIGEYIKEPPVCPVVLNRASTHNATNPFGSTCSYGYQDMIFEVMPNNHIASVTLYQRKKHVKKQSPEV